MEKPFCIGYCCRLEEYALLSRYHVTFGDYLCLSLIEGIIGIDKCHYYKSNHFIISFGACRFSILSPHKRKVNKATERRRVRGERARAVGIPLAQRLSLSTQSDLCADGVMATRSAMQTGHTSQGSDRSGHDPGQEFISRASLPQLHAQCCYQHKNYI